ncbi:MAG: hypothetical protein ABIE55_03665 [Candidatus Aenigmatarchaeota archaeon]
MKILIAILILATVLIAGCINAHLDVSKSKQEFNCPFEMEIKDAIQNRFLYQKEYGASTEAALVNWNISDTLLFQDDYETKSMTIVCRYGLEKGENINYLYCHFGIFDYTIQQLIVDSQDIVKEKVVHRILEPIIVDTSNNFTVVELKCQKVS